MSEQVCPSCATHEAAGAYCTACLTPTGPENYRKSGRGRPRSTARKPTENRGKPGRPRKVVSEG